MDVTWRPATEDDVEFLTEVALTTLQPGRRPEGAEEAEYRTGYADWTREQLRGEEPDSMLYVLEERGERVGRLRVVRPGSYVEVAGIQVHPDHQGRGIGTEVLASLAAEAHAYDVPLELGVEHDNPRARALYERLGFRPVGETEEETRMRLDVVRRA